MWLIYRWRWVRRRIGGKWGHVTGFFWGKRWVRLSQESVMYDEWWRWLDDIKVQTATATKTKQQKQGEA